jgi:hypothetical protein
MKKWLGFVVLILRPRSFTVVNDESYIADSNIVLQGNELPPGAKADLSG